MRQDFVLTAHFAGPNLRVLHQHAIALLPDGNVIPIQQLHHQKPLLVLNRDELNDESIDTLIENGFYKRLFCDTRRTDKLIEHHITHHPPDKSADMADSMLHRLNQATASIIRSHVVDDQFGAYYSFSSADAQERELSKLYDTSLAQCRSQWPQIMASLREVEKEPVPYHAMDKSMAEREAQLSRGLSHLPADALYLLNQIGVQVIMANNLAEMDQAGSGGTSEYMRGVIQFSAKQSSWVLAEECIHQLDSRLDFTRQQEWKDAVKQDMACSAPARTLLRKHGMLPKTSIEKYKPSAQATEMLPELMILDLNMLHPDGQSLKQCFPHCWPLYQDFRKQVAAEAKRAGYEAPTPVTQIDSAQTDGRLSLYDRVRQLSSAFRTAR